MKELAYLINDVRLATDNTDTNGVKDREIVRYFNDGVKSIQALVFKNNPLCSYFQESEEYDVPASGREYTLPSTCYADNAVSVVELSGSSDNWTPLDRVLAEDRRFGWFTRNKKVVLTGDENDAISEQLRAWFFKRLPRFDKSWATVASIAGQTINLTVSDSEFINVDKYASIKTTLGVDKLAGLRIVSSTATSITIAAGTDISSLVAGDILTMGERTSLTLDMPDEVETYLLDYVAKRLTNRNNYAESLRAAEWSKEAKDDLIAIFGDVGQSLVAPPITDTDFLRL